MIQSRLRLHPATAPKLDSKGKLGGQSGDGFNPGESGDSTTQVLPVKTEGSERTERTSMALAEREESGFRLKQQQNEEDLHSSGWKTNKERAAEARHAWVKSDMLNQGMSRKLRGRGVWRLRRGIRVGNLSLRVVRIQRYGLCAKLRTSHIGRKETKKSTVPDDEIWRSPETRLKQRLVKKTETEKWSNTGKNFSRQEGSTRPDVEERSR